VVTIFNGHGRLAGARGNMYEPGLRPLAFSLVNAIWPMVDICSQVTYG
jgi:hypothetical protein